MSIVEHKKHWPSKAVNDSKLASQTAGAQSAKYLCNFKLESLEFALHFAMRLNWRRIAEERVSFLFVRFARHVGASEGELTECVRFSLSYPDGLVHSQPILEKRKPEDFIFLDELEQDIWPNMAELYSSATIDEDQEWHNED